MTARIKQLKQFFTPEKYSQILVNNLSIKHVNKIVDLTMGEGILLKEASIKWPQAKLFGNDIDVKCCNKIITNMPKVDCYNKNIFINSSIEKLRDNIGEVDLCLGNPPFALIEQTDDTKQILDNFSLANLYKAKYVPAEVLFILQCLRILKQDGTLSVILPDGFFVNTSFENFRNFLITKFSIIDVVELPREIFENTKAKTHILTLKKSAPTSKNITLFSVLNTTPIKVRSFEAISRMDYGFYSHAFDSSQYKKLADFKVELIRGTPKYCLKDFDHSHILHTTNFRSTNLFKSPLKTPESLSKHENRIAKRHDIIIPRVGTNILGKVGIVKSGFFIATDCIFIIRTSHSKDRKLILKALKSEFGRRWIDSISKGVGARHITLKDIINLPIHPLEHKI